MPSMTPPPHDLPAPGTGDGSENGGTSAARSSYWHGERRELSPGHAARLRVVLGMLLDHREARLAAERAQAAQEARESPDADRDKIASGQ